MRCCPHAVPSCGATQPGQPGTSDFALRYTYDPANRLIAVGEVDGASVRPLKTFHYARTNDGTDLRAGKLVLSKRINWVDIVGPLDSLTTDHHQPGLSLRWLGWPGVAAPDPLQSRQRPYRFRDRRRLRRPRPPQPGRIPAPAPQPMRRLRPVARNRDRGRQPQPNRRSTGRQVRRLIAFLIVSVYGRG